MLYVLGWFTVLMILAAWSFAAWGVNALAAWTLSNAGALSGAAAGIEQLRLPQWLALWVPPEIAQAAMALQASLAPLVEGLLQAVPALAGGVTVAVWIVWGLGSLALLLLGLGLHLLVAMWRRGGGGPGFAARAGAQA